MARPILLEHVLQPGTGKAVPLSRGQVLCVEQVEGGQCADFNAFNLHDYKERFDAARTRYMHGSAPTSGDFLWSAPPRERPMLVILRNDADANDVTYQRCSAFMYEFQAGYANHTNCQDIQAEAQREYGLTPDDVHDPFNMFMATSLDAAGKPYVAGNPARPGDRIELLALFDVLAVPNICGSDTSPVSNFSLKPLKLSVREASDAEKTRWLRPAPGYRNQRGPESFKVKEIKATRELIRDPGYMPEWPAYPIPSSTVEVELADREAALLQGLTATGRLGDDEGEVLKRAFFSWWIENRRRGPQHFSILEDQS
jgi:uncharacterized protein YcgI (DUF1989 family)